MSKDKAQYRSVGEFEVTSGKIVVKDPCYPEDSGSVFPAKNGRWGGEVLTDGRIIYELKASVTLKAGSKDHVEVCEEGVDSGQMGVFDEKYAHRSESEDYERIMKMTLGKKRSGIIDSFGSLYGVVSSTAWGDGSYPVSVVRDIKTGEVTSVRIDFDPVADDDYYDPDELAGTEEDKDDDVVPDERH